MTNEVAGYLLSSQQLELWRLHRLSEDNPYVSQTRLAIPGTLDRERLVRVITRVVNRYDVLRTVYRWLPDGGLPVQVVEPPVAAVSLPEISIDGLPPEVRDRRLEGIIRNDRGVPFPLETGPLFRALLIRQSDRDHLLQLTFSSLIADGASLPIVAAEIALSYDSPDLDGDEPIQYLQYSEYQNQWVQEEEGQAARASWDAGSAAAPDPPIPGRRQAANCSRYRLEFEPVGVSPQLADAVDQFSQMRGVPRESVWLACWQALLARLSGERTYRMGYTASGRPDEELAGMPGPFARCLPIDCLVDVRDSLAALVPAVHERLRQLEAIQEGHVPEAAPRPFAACFEFGTWEREVFTCSQRFVIRLSCQELAERVLLRLDYDSDSIAPEQARVFASSFVTVASGMLAEPNRPIREIPLLAGDLLQQVVGAWNATHSHYDSDALVHEQIAARATLTPDDTAVIEEGKRTSLSEFNRKANRLAHYLLGLGVRPESIVSVCSAPSTEAIVAILGILKAGGAFLPIDPAYPKERIDFMLADAGASVQLTSAAWPDTTGYPDHDPPNAASAQNAAYVIYTSGSTGRPKGAVIEHTGLRHYIDWCLSAYAAGGGRGAPLHSSLAFDLSITSIFAPLAAGQSIVIAPPRAAAEGLAQVLREGHEFSWIKLTPSHARLLQGPFHSTTRTLIVGGEALTTADLASWIEAAPDTILVNEYGPTECVVGCIVYESKLRDLAEGAVAIGRPIANAAAYVLDTALFPVPPGVAGELYIGGASLARGYFGRAAQTAERFVPDPFSGHAGARLYRTGDLVRYRCDGVLEYIGRADFQVKIRGHRIEPGEIECVLAIHPAIQECAVVARGAGDMLRLVAYYVPAQSQSAPAVSELREFVGRDLPEYMVPSAFVPLDRLPLNANGKVNRTALPEPDAVATGAAGYAGPRTLEEEVLATIWAKVLGLPRVSIDDDYFTLGGDSIRAIQVVGQAGQRGLDISIEMIFRHRTVRELARALRLAGGETARVLAPEPFSLISPEVRAEMPPEIEDAYPLSALQAGMIFHREYHPESAIYHDIFGYHLRMPLDIEKLDQAARALVSRHPALRTAFHLDDFPEPLQLVHLEAPSPLRVTDISHLNEAQQIDALTGWMEEEKRRGFDYHKPPLLRFWIHKRSADSFQFSLSFHHAIIDGWSDASMLVELAVSYQCLLDGKPIPFEAPETRYREFVALERQSLASESHRAYWAGKLHGCRPLTLPRRERVPPSPEGSRGVKLQVVPISDAISNQLRELSRTLAVPLKSVLLAAHMKVMGALAGVTDVLSSLSSAGRPETLDGNQVLGLHLNSTPIRLSLDGGAWTDLIRDAFQNEREALPFRRYPLAEIQRLTGSRRLAETSFYYTHYHNIQQLSGLPQFEILGRMVYEETSFAMVANFNLDPFSGILGLTLACDQTQFGPEERQMLGDYYERALIALAEHPESRYDHLDLMPPAEAAHVLELSATTGSSANAELLPNRIARQARLTPESIAVVCGDRRLNYRELMERAAGVAQYLRSLGAGPDTLVGLSLPRSADLIVGIVGIHLAGAAYLPIDPDYPEARRKQILEDAKPLTVLTEPLPAAAVIEQAPSLTGGQLAYVIYTSGSTGRPKGTLISHANLASSTAARLQYYRDPVEAFLLLSSYAFDSSVAGIFWTLATGGTLILPTEGAQRDPIEILDLLQQHRVSHMLALPSLYEAILEGGQGRTMPHLRSVIVAGEACPARLVERHLELRPETRLYNEYGPTEATVWSTVAECNAAGETVPIGKPVPGSRAYILGTSLALTPLGTAGELYIAGPGIARGYLERPAITAAAFLPDPFSTEPGSRMYRTGDAALRRNDAAIEFLGRVDHQVKIRGHRIELGEIEEVLRGDSEIAEAVVVAHEENPGDARLIAYIVAPSKPAAARPSVREFLQARLPEYMLPARFIFLDAMPRTPNGKIDRFTLPAPDGGRSGLGKPFVAPRNEVETTLATIWSKVLGREQVGVEDDFFELGGDSILSIQILARAKQAGLRFQPAQLFQQRTIAALAPLAQDTREAAAEPETPSSDSGLSGSEVDLFLDRVAARMNAAN